MKNITIVSFICILIISCSGPGRQTPESGGTKQFDMLQAIYRDSAMLNPEATIRVLSEAFPQIRDSIYSYTIMLYLATCYFYLNDVSQSKDMCVQVLDFCNHNPVTSRLSMLKAGALNAIGVYFSRNGLSDSALVYLLESYDMYPLVETGINIADCYHLKGDYPKASQYYRNVLFTVDSIGTEQKDYFSIYSGLAKLYQDLDNFKLAEQYYDKAVMYGDHTLPYNKWFFENSRGNFYFFIKEYEKALVCFQSAVLIGEMISQTYLQAIARGNLGEVFIFMGQLDSSRIYLDQAKELAGPLFDEPSFNFYFNGLYASLALLEGNLPEAEKLLLRPYDTLSVNPQYIYYHNRRLQELYFRKQDYKKAYNYFAEAETFNDSIRTVKVRNNISEIDARYSQDTTILKKNIQIAMAENKVLQWKYTTGISVLLFVLMLALVIGIVVYYRKINELRHIKQVSTITGLRMEIIRNRLSPHFMFNALNLIMPRFGQYKELEEPFHLLVQILRDNLIASEQIAVPLQQEIMRVQNFLRFHDLKQTGAIRVDWTVHPEISTEQHIPSMFIQIPVENAIKYAFQPDFDHAHLQIIIQPEACTDTGPNVKPNTNLDTRIKYDAIRITIEDNGVGYDPAQSIDHGQGTGSGLKMLRRTVDLLNDNNTAITFKIENKRNDIPPGQGTRVTLIIPLNTNYIHIN